MKKLCIAVLALFFAVPAATYAGSVTSKYDVTIGGHLKLDVGWMSQGAGVDYRAASPSAKPGQGSLADDYPNVNWFGGQTFLNFAIKGPDAWGAKTSAFIEGDFRGVAGSARNGAGSFTLRHAFMTFAWPDTTLLLGHSWQPWGLNLAFNILGFGENHFNKGYTRVPQIRVTQKFAKYFAAQFAVAATNQTLWGNNGGTYVDDTNRALWPDTSLDLSFKSPVCGQIGHWPLTLGLGGMWGKERVTYTPFGTTRLMDKDIDRWGAAFYGYIPILPEKKGNKAGALGVTGNVFTGQGLSAILPAYPGVPFNTPYDRGRDVLVGGGAASAAGTSTIDPKYALATGAWAQVTYYFTNAVFTNVLWGYQTNHLSQTYMRVNPGHTRNIQNFIVNVMYDVNPAVRLAVEYTRVTTAYGTDRTGLTTEAKGSLDAVRFAAQYFF